MTIQEEMQAEMQAFHISTVDDNNIPSNIEDNDNDFDIGKGKGGHM